MNILALMTDSYRGFGGIAQYNRDVLDAISCIDEVDRVVALPRLNGDGEHQLPRKLIERPAAGSVPGYVLQAVREARARVPDMLLCGHLNLLPVASLLKRFLRVPLVLELYGIEAWTPPAQRARRLGLRDIDLAISISRFTRERFLDWADIPPSRIKVVPNAIHLDRYHSGADPEQARREFGLQGKTVLLTVSRLSATERYKGHDRLIRLLPRIVEAYPKLIYLIAGDGDDRSRLESMARSLQVLDHVRFLGRVGESELLSLYNFADGFAMPSTGEGFGFVFLEAAACGVPVLGGSVDGSLDALNDGAIGLAVDPTDDNALLQAVVETLRRPKQTPAALTAYAYEEFRLQIAKLVRVVHARGIAPTRL